MSSNPEEEKVSRESLFPCGVIDAGHGEGVGDLVRTRVDLVDDAGGGPGPVGPDALKKDLKAIYTAPTAEAAEFALEELEEKWGKKYRAIIRLWRNAWTEFIPFLDYGACCKSAGRAS